MGLSNGPNSRMSILKSSSVAAVFCVLVAASSGARAICAISEAGYTGGTFGAAASAATGCFQAPLGGTGFASIATPANGQVSASADLGTAYLKVFANNGSYFPSAALWDTITFSGLPAGGALLAEALTLTGSITGSTFASVLLSIGDPNIPAASHTFVLNSGNFPASVSVDFMAQNDTPVLIYATEFADGFGGTVDLSDPPRLQITVPIGTSFKSSSGVFENVVISAVPEPAVSALLLVGG